MMACYAPISTGAAVARAGGGCAEICPHTLEPGSSSAVTGSEAMAACARVCQLETVAAWSVLPPEILSHIVRFLPLGKNWMAMALVCKAYAALVSDELRFAARQLYGLAYQVSPYERASIDISEWKPHLLTRRHWPQQLAAATARSVRLGKYLALPLQDSLRALASEIADSVASIYASHLTPAFSAAVLGIELCATDNADRGEIMLVLATLGLAAELPGTYARVVVGNPAAVASQLVSLGVVPRRRSASSPRAGPRLVGTTIRLPGVTGKIKLVTGRRPAADIRVNDSIRQVVLAVKLVSRTSALRAAPPLSARRRRRLASLGELTVCGVHYADLARLALTRFHVASGDAARDDNSLAALRAAVKTFTS